MTTKKQKQNDGNRRYSTGKNPIYHEVYDRLMTASPVLSKESRARDIHHFAIFSDKHTTELELIKLVGSTEDGSHNLNEVKELGYIALAEKKLAEIHHQFKRWAEDQVKRGNAYSLPEEWPSSLSDEKFKLEAVCDIRFREKKVLEREIEKLKTQDSEKRGKKVLKYFPGRLGFNPEQHNPEICDQKVSFSRSGIPFIDEPLSSPYNRMPVREFKRMAKDFRKKQDAERDELEKKRKEEIRKHGTSDVSVPGFGSKNLPKSKLPAWPEGVPNIDDIEKELSKKTA